MSFLPLATPYHWPDDDDDFIPSQLHSSSETTYGSGFSYLQSQLLASDMSGPAKRILVDILKDGKVELKGTPPPKKRYGKKVSSLCTTVLDSSSMNDSTVLRLAGEGQISFLGSLLTVIERGGHAPVTSKYLVQTCALTVNPAKTPGKLDAREMVLAALHFLTQECDSSVATVTVVEDDGSILYPETIMPLIRPLSITGDLERRSYEKSYVWSLADIMPQVTALEEHFYEGGHEYRWLPREKFLPATQDVEARRQFLLKGHMPGATKLPTGKAAAALSRNTSSATTATKKNSRPAASGHHAEIISTNKNPVATEASRIMTKTKALSDSS